MSDDYLKNIEFNFDSKKDIPELFVRYIQAQSEAISLRQFILNYFPDILGKPEKEIAEEIDSMTESAKKELYAQLAVQRGE